MNDKMKNIIYYIVFVLVVIFPFTQGMAQKKKTEIQIIHSNTLEYNEKFGPDLKKLIGEVELQHEDVFMYCDSAYLYDNQNLVEAFSNVYIRRGDTLHLYGDFLRYEGEVKLAIIRRNVTLIDNEAELNTEFLDYDLNTDVGYYFNGGIILSDENTLSSILGNYNTKQKEFHFKDSVVIVNPDYTIFSDTLKYNTVSEISYFFGPTEIIGDSSYLYCEDGWYNTKTDISNLRKNALVKSKNQIVKGDSIYYEKINGYGKAYSNVELTDTLKDIIIRGNFSEYFEQPERFFVTDSAVFIQITSTDSLFVHADTLRSFMDSTETYRTVSAYYHCKMYKDDFQAKCDSMVYSFRDSVIHLYNDPVLWSEKNQLTADSIAIFTENGHADHLEMYNSAFIITQEDSIRFNQIKGKNMIAFFRDDDLYRINVTGNGETIYYTIDEEEIIGVNQALCSDIIIYLENEEISKISFLVKPDGIMTPPGDEDPENLKLEGFSWLESFRPLNKWDIFKWK